MHIGIGLGAKRLASGEPPVNADPGRYDKGQVAIGRAAVGELSGASNPQLVARTGHGESVLQLIECIGP